MTCKEVERLLTEDISLGNDARVEAHIGRCSVCRELHRDLDSMSEFSRLLLEMDQAPADFSSRVYEGLAQHSLWQLQWKLAVVLGLVILGLITFLWIQEEQPVPEGLLVSEKTPQEEPFARVKDGDWVEGTYVDVILKSPAEPEYILRLPSRINIRTKDLNHDIYLNNASY